MLKPLLIIIKYTVRQGELIMENNKVFTWLFVVAMVTLFPVNGLSDDSGNNSLNTFEGILLAQEKPKPLTFIEVVDNLDIKKHTKFHVKEYIRMNKGAEVVASGKVVDVIGGRGKAKILVGNKARRIYKGYNIVLTVTFDIDKAAGLRKDQHIKFRGFLSKYKGMKYGGVIIYLHDAEIL